MTTDSSDDEYLIFQRAIDKALDNPEVKKELAEEELGPLLPPRELRRHLAEKRDELTEAITAQRQRWQRAVQSSEGNARLLPAEIKASRHPWLRRIAWFFAILFVVFVGAAIAYFVAAILEHLKITGPTADGPQWEGGAFFLSLPSSPS